MKKVKVYFFEKYDINFDKTIRSKRPATLDFIKKNNFVILKNTEQTIDDNLIDGNGLLITNDH